MELKVAAFTSLQGDSLSWSLGGAAHGVSALNEGSTARLWGQLTELPPCC